MSKKCDFTAPVFRSTTLIPKRRELEPQRIRQHSPSRSRHVVDPCRKVRRRRVDGCAVTIIAWWDGAISAAGGEDGVFGHDVQLGGLC